jgi:hypothetical protein
MKRLLLSFATVASLTAPVFAADAESNIITFLADGKRLLVSDPDGNRIDVEQAPSPGHQRIGRTSTR